MPDEFKSLIGTFNGKFSLQRVGSILTHGFDLAVFTNATLHWCKRDPSGVVHGAKRVLKPGGRFVGEFGGYLNCVGE